MIFFLIIIIFKYLHQCDDIIVIKNGSIIEHGSFGELMKQKGHLSELISEHVQVLQNKENLTKNSTSGTYLEENQFKVVGFCRGSTASDPIHLLERNRLSIVTRTDTEFHDDQQESCITPEDSQQMKLVLEDESVNYEKSPAWAYLRASAGAFLSIILYCFFFTTYTFRMGIGINR